MATFELTTRMTPVQRSQGDSATARAAYRACCIIECEREGRIHDYRRKAGLQASEITIPTGGPRSLRWALDRSRLWNEAELVERNGKRGKNAGAFKANAQTARDVMFSYPAELSPAGRLAVARTVARHLADTHGVAVDFNIHLPGKEGDERNHHCHMMMTTRRVTANGLGEKAREWDERDSTGPSLAAQLRAFIADALNAELAAEGKAGLVFVEHRSFKERGSGQVPTRHLGVKMHSLRRAKGRAREAWLATQGKAQKERHGKELADMKLRQDFAMQAKLADIDKRGRDGEAAIRRELDSRNREDGAPTGLRRLFLIVTGREGRDAFDRQTRQAQRMEAANIEIKALKSALQAERNAYINSQTRERAALIERHAGEDRQLSQAAAHRETVDRAAERTARQPQRRQEHEQAQTREQRGHGGGRGPSP